MSTATARAYASIANLGHGLDALGVCLDLAWDTVTATAGDRPGVRVAMRGLDAERIPADPPQNTAGQAVLALLAAHAPGAGVDLVVEKGIPAGSGLGSSAASAVAAVVAAEAALGLELPEAARLACAVSGEAVASGARHADNVAPSLLGGFVIVDAAARLAPLRLPRADRIRLVVAQPDHRVNTVAARAALPRSVPLHDYSVGVARTAMIVAAWSAGDPAALAAAAEGSFVDAARGRLIPGFDEVCAAARAAGAYGVTIGGAGPALVAIVRPESSDAVAAAMERAFGAHGVGCRARAVGVGPGAHLVDASA